MNAGKGAAAGVEGAARLPTEAERTAEWKRRPVETVDGERRPVDRRQRGRRVHASLESKSTAATTSTAATSTDARPGIAAAARTSATHATCALPSGTATVRGPHARAAALRVEHCRCRRREHRDKRKRDHVPRHRRDPSYVLYNDPI